MKKSILLVALFALVAGALVTGNAQAATYENLAIQAAKDAGCISNIDNKYLTVDVQVTSVCFVTGEIHTAYVYYDPQANCHPNKPCPMGPIALKAQVEFGCDNTITSVVCY